MANLLPEECRPHCDVLFEGEAEYTWPRFLARLRRRPARRPLPSSTRRSTCPTRRRRASTCSTKPLRPRHRAVHARLPVHLRVLRHHRHVRPQDALQAGRAGARRRSQAWHGRGRGAGLLRRRQLRRQPRLRQGAAARRWPSGTPSSSTPLSFYTQASVDMVRDEELLGLLRDANFFAVFLGIESPRKASLAETHKTQNEKLDLVEAVHKIQSYNLFVSAGMIVGFDQRRREHLRRAVRVPAGGADPDRHAQRAAGGAQDAAVQAARGRGPAADHRPDRDATARTTSAPAGGTNFHPLKHDPRGAEGRARSGSTSGCTRRRRSPRGCWATCRASSDVNYRPERPKLEQPGACCGGWPGTTGGRGRRRGSSSGAACGRRSAVAAADRPDGRSTWGCTCTSARSTARRSTGTRGSRRRTARRSRSRRRPPRRRPLTGGRRPRSRIATRLSGLTTKPSERGTSVPSASQRLRAYSED